MTNADALKTLYVAFGGALSDTYDDIASGITVSKYTTSADVILAISKQVTANNKEEGGNG